MSEYDEGDQLFYKKLSRSRPKCGSVFMKEDFGKILKAKGIPGGSNKFMDEYKRLSDKWMKWSESRQVKQNGFCDEFKAKNN